MTDTNSTVSTPAPRKRRIWLRVLLGLFAVLILLVVIGYFVGTSSAFLQRQILPRLSAALNMDVTVSSAEIHPFSRVVLHDLKVQATNQPPLLTASEARVSYSLMDILGGNIHVDELAIESPTIQVVENADGSSNLDPLLKSQKKSATDAPKPASAATAKPLQVDVRLVTIANATISRVQNHSNGTRDLVQVTNVSVKLTGLKNGQSGKLEFSALIRDENNPPAPAMYGLLRATVGGSFTFAFTQDLKPSSILGDAHLDISQAAGSFSDFAKLTGILHCDLSPTEIRAVSLNFARGDEALGELRASGPFDAQKSEGKLNVELLSVDKKVLNLLGAKSGFDFGPTTMTWTNQIELTKGGAAVAVVGELSASNFQLNRTNQSTPALDLRANYNVTVDQADQSALLRELNITGMQAGRALLRGQLTSPMTLSWGSQSNAVGDSAFSLAVMKLNLTDWKIFLGNLVSAGTVDVNLNVLSQQGGKQLIFDTTNVVQNLTVDAGAQHISQTTVSLNARGKATDLKQFALSNFGLGIAKSNQTALAVSGSGTYDTTSGNADVQVSARATLARLVAMVAQTNLTVTAGTADLNAHVTQQGTARGLTGTFSLTNLAGTMGDKKLSSVSLNGTAGLQQAAGGDLAINANLQMTNLVVTDSAHPLPMKPLEAKLLVDASYAKEIADVRQLQLTLTPTDRAKNQLQIQGRVDISQLQAIQGSLKLSADSLDVTSYYDLLTATNQPAPVSKAKSATTAEASTPATASATTTNSTPFRNFTVDASVRAFYLREIAATNFLATIKLNGGHVQVAPLQLTLNGSPLRMTADVNLDVPGYQYAVTFNATNVPFAPLWNTFQPADKGHVGGTISALVDISGTGTGGESLQKTLRGTFAIGTTNLNLSVNTIHNPALRLVVAVVANIPELANNPLSAATALAGGALKGAFKGELSGDIDQSPIDVISARGTAGSGVVTLQEMLVRSRVFEATVTNGTVTLAPVLTNSPINIPVGLALNRSLTARIPSYLFADASSTNGSYARLVDFFSETGTVGDPKPKFNTAVLAKRTLQGLVPGLGGGSNTNGTGNLIQGVGNLLQGGGARTNQPATNQSPVNNLLNQFLK